MKVPELVECPECAEMRKTHKGRFITHAVKQFGPECERSRKAVTAADVMHTHHVQRAQKVLLWAHTLREEDPRKVHRLVARCERRELEAMLLTALAGIGRSDRITLDSAYAWVRELAVNGGVME